MLSCLSSPIINVLVFMLIWHRLQSKHLSIFSHSHNATTIHIICSFIDTTETHLHLLMQAVFIHKYVFPTVGIYYTHCLHNRLQILYHACLLKLFCHFLSFLTNCRPMSSSSLSYGRVLAPLGTYRHLH